MVPAAWDAPSVLRGRHGRTSSSILSDRGGYRTVSVAPHQLCRQRPPSVADRDPSVSTLIYRSCTSYLVAFPQLTRLSASVLSASERIRHVRHEKPKPRFVSAITPRMLANVPREAGVPPPNSGWQTASALPAFSTPFSVSVWTNGVDQFLSHVMGSAGRPGERR
jgi:hypothetical protein